MDRVIKPSRCIANHRIFKYRYPPLCFEKEEKLARYPIEKTTTHAHGLDENFLSEQLTWTSKHNASLDCKGQIKMKLDEANNSGTQYKLTYG